MALSHPLEPTPEALGGAGPGRAARRYFLATRPKFLTASVLPVLVGTAWGWQVTGSLDALALWLALLATALVHASANVLNDVYDDIGGSDTINEARYHPFTGGSRFIQNGVLSRSRMRRFGYALLTAAALAGLVLALEHGPGVVALGLAGAALGVAYSMPPLELVSRGIGDAVVAVAFGVLPVAGASWLQGAPVSGTVLLLALPVSCLVAAILLVNEVPDMPADAAAGKRTLPVRIGVPATRRVYRGLHATALLGFAALAVAGVVPALFLAVPAPLAVLAIVKARGIDAGAGRAALEAAIAVTPPVHAVACAWLAGWLAYGAWVA